MCINVTLAQLLPFGLSIYIHNERQLDHQNSLESDPIDNGKRDIERHSAEVEPDKRPGW
jgi:hypothetical protein